MQASPRRNSSSVLSPASSRHELLSSPLINSPYTSIDTYPGQTHTDHDNGIVVIAFLTAFTSLLLISIISPFFPRVAHTTLHMSIFKIGLVFGVVPISVLFFSPLAIYTCGKFGHLKMLGVGVLIMGISTILFGFCYSIEFFLLTRAFQGIASTLIDTASLGLLIEYCPQNLGLILGRMERINTISYILGPPIGGLLYWIWNGDFHFPFIVLGAFSLVQFIPIPFLAQQLWVEKQISQCEKQENRIWPEKENQDTRHSQRAGILDVMSIPMILILVANFVAAGSLGFINPIFSLHLMKLLHLDVKEAGFVFMISPMMLLITTPLASKGCDKFGELPIMVTGYILLSISFLLIGPSPWIIAIIGHGKLQYWVCISLATLILGVAISLASIPVFPFIQKIAKSRYAGDSRHTVAGISLTVYRSGEAFGPILGGLLGGIGSLGFEWSTTLWAIVCVVVLILLVLHIIFTNHSHPLSASLVGSNMNR